MLKKYLLAVVVLVLAFLMTSCMKRPALNNEQSSNGPFISNTESQTNNLGSNSQVSGEIVTLCVGNAQFILNSNDKEYLTDLFNSHFNEIIADIYKFSYDYSFIIEMERWEYCSESGAFCNTTKNQSFLISESEKNELNLIIQSVLK